MLFVRELQTDERQALDQAANNPSLDWSQRARIILLSAASKTVPDISGSTASICAAWQAYVLASHRGARRYFRRHSARRSPIWPTPTRGRLVRLSIAGRYNASVNIS